MGSLIHFHGIYFVLGPGHIEINETGSLPLQRVASKSRAGERRTGLSSGSILGKLLTSLSLQVPHLCSRDNSNSRFRLIWGKDCMISVWKCGACELAL